MINIVHLDVNYDDDRRLTSMEIKLKSIPEEAVNENSQHLIARINAAFYSLALFSEAGKTAKIEINPRRRNIVNLNVTLWENNLRPQDIAAFIDGFQEALDNSPF